ncbi:MAG: PilZ domain-containing protein [Myxococcales bacterium]|nr:PilZ domain-containing protein [Myxococcales bacterium]
MLEPPPLASRRRSLRRAVHVETEVLSDIWDERVWLMATNLSLDGLWLQSPLPLDPGDEVLLTLRPPRWRYSDPLLALAQVVRVALPRRRHDVSAPGMGLRFIGLEWPLQRALREALMGLPPPLPGHGCDGSPVPQAPPERASQPAPAAVPAAARVAHDGLEIALVAEAELLTAGRGVSTTARPMVSDARLPAQDGARSANVIDFPRGSRGLGSRFYRNRPRIQQPAAH